MLLLNQVFNVLEYRRFWNIIQFWQFCTASWTHMRQKSWNLQFMFPLNQRCNILNLKKKNQSIFFKHVQLQTPDADNERKAIEIIGGIDWLIWKGQIVLTFQSSLNRYWWREILSTVCPNTCTPGKVFRRRRFTSCKFFTF